MQPLIQDALNNVWSVPDPFNQVIFKPSRITSNGGAIRTARIGWNNVTLPGTGAWHVYQVGQIHPLMLNLYSTDGVWQLVSDSCNAAKTIVNIYTEKGLELPRARSYFMRTTDRNLVFAVEINPKISADLNTEALFVRIYRNIYFQGSQSAVFNVAGGIMLSNNTITALQAEIETIRSDVNYRGGLYCFVNGVKREAINIITTKPGDVAEYVYDSSIYKVVDIPLSSIQSFTSTLDNKSKWLLHYDSGWDGTIDHCSDIDVYLVDTVAKKGCYVHKNAADTLRMVTFKDYSIVASYVRGYYPSFYDAATGSLNLNNLFIRLHIRYSGHEAVPTGDCYKTPYILKLPLDQQLGAMVGANASLDTWQAANLEASAYNQLMLQNRAAISVPLVEQAYGYNAINRAFGKNIVDVQTIGQTKFANVPAGFQVGATAYEYNSAGLLLGNYAVSTNVPSYTCHNNQAATVEFIQGEATTSLDIQGGNTTLTFVPGLSYRYYDKGTTNVSGRPILNSYYSDVTGNNAHYTVNSSNQITWVPVHYRAGGSFLHPTYRDDVFGIVLSDKKHYFNQASLNPVDGVLYYSIPATVAVELGEYDFWLNGHPLVEGVDYIFKYPAVMIFSKAYLSPAGQASVLTVRGKGFKDPSGNNRRRAETGFVFDGALSANNQFDLHENMSLRVVCAGSLITGSKQAFIEQVSSGTLTNGAPYEIRQVVNPLAGIVVSDPYLLSDQDYAVQQKVSNFLSLNVPQVTASPINPIVNKYQLYSPFICKIIYALLNNNISSGVYGTQYSDDVVRTTVSSYTYLLDYDPIKDGNTPDLEYVVIHPHWLETTITLSADQYRFLSNVVRIYAKDKVVLSTLVSIG